MNLGAGQPASLPYGVEPQRWYSYHSMQFSSHLQQSPFSSVCYHPPVPGNYPPPNHYPPPHYFVSPNPYPPQLNSYPPPTMPNPYSAYAYQPHFIPTNQFVSPPHIIHEPPPNLEVPIVDSSHSSSQFSDARLDGFIESVSRLLDNCISKCMKGIREASLPSVPTRPVTKSSSPLGDAQCLSVSRPHIKQACGEAISATGGVKKPRQWKRNKLLMHNKFLLKGLVLSSRLDNIVSVQRNNTYSVSGTDNNLSFMNIGCSGIDFLLGDMLADIDVTYDNEKRKSSDMMQNKDEIEFSLLEGDSVKEHEHCPNLYVKGSECRALHLLDEMSKPKGLFSAGMTVAGTSIRDKGGGLVHQPLELAIAVNNEEEDDIEYVHNHSAPNIDIGLSGLAGNSCQMDFGQSSVTQGPSTKQQPVPAMNPIGTLPMMHQTLVCHEGTTPSIQYGSPSMYVIPLNGVIICKSRLAAMEMPTCAMTNESLVTEMILNSALCKRKISHYALQLWFSGFDKKVRDKGSGHRLLTILDKEFTAGNVRLLSLLMSLGMKCIRVRIKAWEKARAYFDTGKMPMKAIHGDCRLGYHNHLVHLHDKQLETQAAVLHCFSFMISIINVSIVTIAPFFNHAWGLQIHKSEPPYEYSLRLIAEILVVASYVYQRRYKDGRILHLDDSLNCYAYVADLSVYDYYEMHERMRLYVTIYIDHRGKSLDELKGSLCIVPKYSDLSEPQLSRIAFLCRYENVISTSQSDMSHNSTVADFLLLKWSGCLQWISQVNIQNETTSATFLWVLVVNCDLFLKQPHYYLKSHDELEGVIIWRKGQGYLVNLGNLDNRRQGEFLVALLLLNKMEREVKLMVAHASSLERDGSGCMRNGELGFYTAALKKRIAKNGAVATTFSITLPGRVGQVHLIRKEVRAKVPGIMAYVAVAIADVVDSTPNSILLLFVADGVFIHMSSSPCASTFWKASEGAYALRYEPTELMILMWIGEGLGKSHFSVEGILILQLHCGGIMNQFWKNLSSNQLYQYVKPPTVSCLGTQSLIVIFNCFHKCISYFPFEYFNHLAKLGYVYIFLDFWVILCEIKYQGIVADTSNGYCLHLYVSIILLTMLEVGVLIYNIYLGWEVDFHDGIFRKMRCVASFLVSSYTHSGTLKHAYNIHKCVIFWPSMINEDEMHGYGKERVKGLRDDVPLLEKIESSKWVYYLKKQGKSCIMDDFDESSFTAAFH